MRSGVEENLQPIIETLESAYGIDLREEPVSFLHQEPMPEIYDSFIGNFESDVAESIPTHISCSVAKRARLGVSNNKEDPMHEPELNLLGHDSNTTETISSMEDKVKHYQLKSKQLARKLNCF